MGNKKNKETLIRSRSEGEGEREGTADLAERFGCSACGAAQPRAPGADARLDSAFPTAQSLLMPDTSLALGGLGPTPQNAAGSRSCLVCWLLPSRENRLCCVTGKTGQGGSLEGWGQDLIKFITQSYRKPRTKPHV